MCNPSTQDRQPAYGVSCCCGIVFFEKPLVFQHFHPGAACSNFMLKSFKTLKTLKNQCFYINLTPLMDLLRCLLEAMTGSKPLKNQGKTDDFTPFHILRLRYVLPSWAFRTSKPMKNKWNSYILEYLKPPCLASSGALGTPKPLKTNGFLSFSCWGPQIIWKTNGFLTFWSAWSIVPHLGGTNNKQKTMDFLLFQSWSFITTSAQPSPATAAAPAPAQTSPKPQPQPQP